MESIEIPESVISISTGAFANCYKLNEVTIKGATTILQKGCFTNCNKAIIKCPINSFANKYAKENNIKTINI